MVYETFFELYNFFISEYPFFWDVSSCCFDNCNLDWSFLFSGSDNIHPLHYIMLLYIFWLGFYPHFSDDFNIWSYSNFLRRSLCCRLYPYTFPKEWFESCWDVSIQNKAKLNELVITFTRSLTMTLIFTPIWLYEGSSFPSGHQWLLLLIAAFANICYILLLFYGK